MMEYTYHETADLEDTVRKIFALLADDVEKHGHKELANAFRKTALTVKEASNGGVNFTLSGLA